MSWRIRLILIGQTMNRFQPSFGFLIYGFMLFIFLPLDFSELLFHGERRYCQLLCIKFFYSEFDAGAHLFYCAISFSFLIFGLPVGVAPLFGGYPFPSVNQFGRVAFINGYINGVGWQTL